MLAVVEVSFGLLVHKVQMNQLRVTKNLVKVLAQMIRMEIANNR